MIPSAVSPRRATARHAKDDAAVDKRNQLQTAALGIPLTGRPFAAPFVPEGTGGAMSAKSPRGEETRLRILRAAADLFHKQGVASTSPEDVMQASETGKGQFYYYFESKQG